MPDDSDASADPDAGSGRSDETDDADATDADPREEGVRDDRREEFREEIETLRTGLDDLEAEIEEVEALREAVESFEAEVEDRTVHREEIEDDLRAYVRRRIRRGHARGWGPYLVLLYGTAMTIGAFALLSGGWSILAMIVIWLSTLGLYVLMVLFGLGLTALSAPGRAMESLRGLTDTLRDLRS